MWQHILQFFQTHHPEHYCALVSIIFFWIIFIIDTDKRDPWPLVIFIAFASAIITGIISIFSIHWIVGTVLTCLIIVSIIFLYWKDCKEKREERKREQEARRQQAIEDAERRARIAEARREARRQKIREQTPPESIWRDDTGE